MEAIDTAWTPRPKAPSARLPAARRRPKAYRKRRSTCVFLRPIGMFAQVASHIVKT